jgi:ribosome-associated protein
MIINSRITIPADELHEDFFLSSGPGGQNVNKVSSAVRIGWNPAESRALPEGLRERLLERLDAKLTADGLLIVESRTHRSQLLNRQEARERLAAIIRGALVVPRKRRPTKPTRGSIEKRLDGKKKLAAKKSFRRKNISE